MKIPLTILCEQKIHCTICRTITQGAEWRAISTKYYEWDGRICPHGKEWIIDRKPLSEKEIAAAEIKIAVCESCEFNKSVTREKNGWKMYTVGCSSCGCGALSLTHGRCPLNKWPK